MPKPPRISETEWDVMRVIWARHPIPAAEVIARLTERDPDWHPKTVRTLLARLVAKGALDYVADGRRYEYRPKVTEAECIAAASGSFLDRVFGGALTPMLAHFVAQRRLTRKDLDELRAMLDSAEAQKRKGKK